jgi:hypothetical protein
VAISGTHFTKEKFVYELDDACPLPFASINPLSEKMSNPKALYFLDCQCLVDLTYGLLAVL